jgi:putative membrane protein
VPTVIQGLPAFIAYFALGAVLLTVFIVIYTRLTAHDEVALVRAGNMAAAIALGATLIGLALPISAAIENTQSILAALVWSVIGCAVQLGAYLLCRALIPDISVRIEKADLSAAMFLGAVSVSAGLLNAACMTY